MAESFRQAIEREEKKLSDEVCQAADRELRRYFARGLAEPGCAKAHEWELVAVLVSSRALDVMCRRWRNEVGARYGIALRRDVGWTIFGLPARVDVSLEGSRVRLLVRAPRRPELALQT